MAAEPIQSSLRTDIPAEQLQKQARWQRAQLREDFAGLKFGLQQAFDPEHLARKYLWQIVSIVSLVGFAGGYWSAGMFARRRRT